MADKAENPKAVEGDNSAYRVTGTQLRSFLERVERLQEEKKAIADDIKDVFAEAKGNGYDGKAMRAILKMRAEDADARREHEAIVKLYAEAIGLFE